MTLAFTTNSTVMAGLVLAIHASDDVFVEIVPIGVGGEDQADFPCPRPMFHVPLALDRGADAGVTLSVNQAFEAIPFGKAWQNAFSRFPDAPLKITGNAKVKDAIRLVCDHVNPCFAHQPMLPRRRWNGNAFVDGRDKPGHDGFYDWFDRV